MLIDIKRAISDNRKVSLKFYRAGQLWYETEFGEAFAVPIDDCGDAAFLPTDKASLFMRWMRQHNNSVHTDKAHEENRA
jgi:hypothetical protein